jgi:hypothetical protein
MNYFISKNTGAALRRARLADAKAARQKMEFQLAFVQALTYEAAREAAAL